MTSVLKVDNIQNSSGTDALTIDSSGLVTKTQTPAFHITYSDGVTCTASGTYYPFTSPTAAKGFNNGGHYDLTNNYFVVPVSGIYVFYFSYLRGSSNNVFRAVVGTDTNGRYNFSPQMRSSEAVNGYNVTSGQSTVFHCTAGDKIRLIVSCDTAGGTIYDDNGNGDYNYFGGYLIG